MPPRQPRALFIAALAYAGGLTVALRRPASRALTAPGRIERRARSLGAILKSFGGAFLAAAEARARFIDNAAAWTPPALPRRMIDPRVAVVMASTRVAAAIGPAEDAPNIDTPWVEFSPDPPRLSIFWGGTLIAADRTSTGKRVSSRQLSMESFGAAVEAAVEALTAAGYPLSGFVDIKRVATPTFRGALATLTFRRAPPAWAQPLVAEPAL